MACGDLGPWEVRCGGYWGVQARAGKVERARAPGQRRGLPGVRTGPVGADGLPSGQELLARRGGAGRGRRGGAGGDGAAGSQGPTFRRR